MNKTKRLIVSILEAFVISFAFFNIANLESGHILILLVFGVSLILINKFRENESVTKSEIFKRTSGIANIMAVVFALLYAVGNYDTIGGGLENPLFVTVFVILTTLGLLVIFYYIVCVLLMNVNRVVSTENEQDARKFSWKIFFIYAGIILLCMIPYFLLNYPGIMTPDSLNQFAQVIGADAYDDHHPWIHTMTIKLFYSIGYGISNDMYVGIATYTIAQMIIMALSVAYTIECMYEMHVKKGYRIALLLFYVLYPFNTIYAMTMWKDIIFSAAVLIFTVTLYRTKVMMLGTNRDFILFVLSAVAMCLYRHNGMYAAIGVGAVLLLVQLTAYKKDDKKDKSALMKEAEVIAVIGIIVWMVLDPVMEINKVTPGESVYNYTIPLQQMARVVADDCDISDEDVALIEKINIISYVKENYIPTGADNMFQWVLYGDHQYFEEHMQEYSDLWIRYGLKHPVLYVEAFIDQTRGYFVPMNAEQTMYFGILENNDFGLETRSVISGPLLIKINEILIKLGNIIPVYGVMYSMGSLFWILLLLVAVVVCRREYNKILAFLPCLMTTVTVFIATPLVADMRYAYELVLALPVMCVFTFAENITKKDEVEILPETTSESDTAECDD